MIEIEDQVPLYRFLISLKLFLCSQYDKAVPELEKALDIFKKWDTKPQNFIYEQQCKKNYIYWLDYMLIIINKPKVSTIF